MRGWKTVPQKLRIFELQYFTRIHCTDFYLWCLKWHLVIFLHILCTSYKVHMYIVHKYKPSAGIQTKKIPEKIWITKWIHHIYRHEYTHIMCLDYINNCFWGPAAWMKIKIRKKRKYSKETACAPFHSLRLLNWSRCCDNTQ